MTSRVRLRARLLLVVVAALLVLGLTAVPAEAVTRRGACSDVSRWALTIRRLDTGGLLVRFRVALGAEGDTWNVFMDHNGTGFFSGSRVSRVDGLVVVRRPVNDLAGPDRVNAGAHDTVTGETCSAHATLFG